MSFPRYPTYKNSVVEWLGEVPEHWEVDRLKYIAKASPSNVDKKSYEGDHAVLLCNYTDVYYNEEIVAGMSFMAATATAEQVDKFTLRAGDTIITKDSETADDIAISAYVPQDLPGVVCGYHLSLIRPREGIDGRFIKRLFDSHFARATLGIAANGLTRYGLSQYPLDNFDLPLPPAGEQTTIANFLDRETAKIDALVADYRTLIELLQEKRQAVISHAVTKGLDPTVPMKDSGVEWLGEVPKAWSICALNYRYDVALGKMLDEKRITGNHLAPYLRNVDVQWGCINVGDLPEMDFEGNDLVRYGLVIGDLLVCEGGEVGRAAIWQGALTECYYQKALHRVRPRSKQTDSPQFLYYVLAAAASLSVFAESEGKSTISHLPAEAFRRYQFAFPPCVEQTAIAVFLDGKTTELDSLITDAKDAITLLQERRTALISAAVTGKIDVRGLLAEEPRVAVPETNLAISQP